LSPADWDDFTAAFRAAISAPAPEAV